MFVIAAEGVKDFDLTEQSEQIDKYMAMAVNRTAERGRAWLAADMTDQVAFPSHYLSKSGGRLTLQGYATPDNAERSIIARVSPTSLARFVAGSQAKGRPVSVRVKPGAYRTMGNSFIINLRNGNKGLAMRLANGVRPTAAFKPKLLRSGVWLLYGPSVDQVFKGILEKEDISYKQIENFLHDEFIRLMDLNL